MKANDEQVSKFNKLSGIAGEAMIELINFLEDEGLEGVVTSDVDLRESMNNVLNSYISIRDKQ